MCKSCATWLGSAHGKHSKAQDTPRYAYRVQIRRRGYRPISKIFDSKAQAVAWAESMEGNKDQIDAFPDAESRRRLVAGVIDEHMLQFTGRDEGMVSRLAWWKAQAGHHTLATFTQHRIRELLEQLAAEPANRGDGRGKRKAVDRRKSPSTINRYLASISSVLRWAVREKQWLARNPALGIGRQKEPRGRVRWLSEPERKALLAACDKSLWPDLGLLVRLALTTGARLNELLILRWQDVDLKRGVAHLHTSKNDEARTLALIPAMRKLLKAKQAALGDKADGLLFPSPRDAAKPFEFRKHWNSATKQAKLQDFRFHDLRHSAAGYLAMNGASLVEIADVLGHKTLAVTRRYSHLSTKHKQKLTARVFGSLVK